MLLNELMDYVVQVLQEMAADPQRREVLAKYKQRILDILKNVDETKIEIVAIQLREKDGRPMVYLNQYQRKDGGYDYVVSAYIDLNGVHARVDYRTQDAQIAERIRKHIEEQNSVTLKKKQNEYTPVSLFGVQGAIKRKQ